MGVCLWGGGIYSQGLGGYALMPDWESLKACVALMNALTSIRCFVRSLLRETVPSSG